MKISSSMLDEYKFFPKLSPYMWTIVSSYLKSAIKFEAGISSSVKYGLSSYQSWVFLNKNYTP